MESLELSIVNYTVNEKEYELSTYVPQVYIKLLSAIGIKAVEWPHLLRKQAM